MHNTWELLSKADSFKWITIDQLKQHNNNIFSNLSSKQLLPNCIVKHEKLSKKFETTKKDLYNCVKHRAYSHIQSLTNQHHQECLDEINNTFKNDDDNIQINLEWIISTAVKTRLDNTSKL